MIYEPPTLDYVISQIPSDILPDRNYTERLMYIMSSWKSAVDANHNSQTNITKIIDDMSHTLSLLVMLNNEIPGGNEVVNEWLGKFKT